LNVWTPSRERISNPLPVLFWLYGGFGLFYFILFYLLKR